MKYLVTGAAGFVGSHLSRTLLAAGHEVVGIDAITSYYDRDLKLANLAEVPQLSLHQADINEVDLDALLDGVDVIFHQAGQPGVRRSWGDEFDVYARQNVLATQRLLEAAKRNGSLRRFVYASSSSVYGNAESFPTPESALPQPMSPYGVTKLAAEHLCGVYAKNFGVNTVSLRYFTVFGPRQRPDMAFTRFCNAAATGDKITIYGDGEQIRDFTYVSDVVRANLLAAEADVAPGSVYNISGGTSSSVNEVLETLTQLADTRLNVEYRPTVAGDVKRTGGDSRAAESELGWGPEVTLRDGLAAQFAWAAERVRSLQSS